MAADCMPLEVLSHIFKFLSLSDRKEAALVCRRWYDATFDPYLQKDVVFRPVPSPADSGGSSSDVVPDDRVGTWLRRKGRVHLAVSTLDDGSSASAACSPQVLRQLSPDACVALASLSIRGADLTESTFASFVARCTNLVSLSVAYCDSVVMSGSTLARCLEAVKLPSLRELNLSHMRHLSDQTLVALVLLCPRLESLSLAANSIVFRSSHLYYDPQSKCPPSGGVLTFACVLGAAVAPHAAWLRRLDLSATAIDDASLAELASVDGLQLDDLSLAACRELSNFGLAALASRQPRLAALDLSQAVGLTAEGLVAALSPALPRLRRLSLAKCVQAVTSAGARALLAAAPLLESLSVGGCYRLDDAAFFAAGGCGKPLLSAASERLTRLDLSYCGLISNRVVLSICAVAPLASRLTHLDLTSCIQLTDRAAAAIARYLRSLTFLSLAWCKEISDYGLLGVEAPPDHEHDAEHGACRCQREEAAAALGEARGGSRRAPTFASFPPVRLIAPALKPPTADDVKRAAAAAAAAEAAAIDDRADSAAWAAVGQASFACLDRLVTLRLAACSRLSDLSLAACVRYVELRDLDVGLCRGVGDATLRAVAEHNPSLERLSCAQCGGVTDDGVSAVVRGCSRLVRLNVSGCGRVTSRTLDAVRKAAPRRLRELDVSLCNIDGRSADALRAALPTLRVVRRRRATSPAADASDADEDE